MTVVIGTAGHIDHGKTTLLHALTGIDADRLPEERRRGMTIDVGYAHLALPDGTELDFVDVPGHDRLVGNMLVGAGEIDAAMLVVAADDGPRAQTLEHLGLLDAIGIRHGIAVVTKADVAGPDRTADVVASVGRVLSGTSLDGAPIVAVSSVDGSGIDDLRAALVALRDRVAGAAAAGDTGATTCRLAIDRVFGVKGRGSVVTGTLRGATLAHGATLRLVPGVRTVRVREVQVHGRTVETAGPGRTALLLAGVETGQLHRGLVLTDDPAVTASDRMLVRLAVPLPDRARARVHLGTAAADGSMGRSGRDALELPDGSAAAIVRLSLPLAVAAGDRCVLRLTTGAAPIVGALVLDAAPPRGIARRRQTNERVGRLAAAVSVQDPRAIRAARLDLHGAIGSRDAGVELAADVAEAVGAAVLAALAAPPSGSMLTQARAVAARSLRRHVSLERTAAVAAGGSVVDRLVADGRLIRDGADIRLPGATPHAEPVADPAVSAAMDRLERALAVAAPPALAEAARVAGCPPAAVRHLEQQGRITVLDADVAYAAVTYREIEALALALATTAPLTPAALRDATGTSRKFVMAILTDLDRRGVLRRTDAGHVPGPRAPSLRDV